ncbi:hypothetical protein X777_13670 [Ooceraea biroi]|uniref:Uncharacterized protein n=1 Tax=Ooceraea biroi TaxID=2015173 RepID=A0A026VXM3_OOCBI|nr:hypothetical protein X777_13670 [Ooceraea biroi]
MTGTRMFRSTSNGGGEKTRGESYGSSRLETLSIPFMLPLTMRRTVGCESHASPCNDDAPKNNGFLLNLYLRMCVIDERGMRALFQINHGFRY